MYTEKYLRDLQDCNPFTRRRQHTKLVPATNVHTSALANVLQQSRKSIYNWFKGGAVRSRNVDRIEIFMRLVSDYVVRDELPMQTYKETKQFMKDHILGKL